MDKEVGNSNKQARRQRR